MGQAACSDGGTVKPCLAGNSAEPLTRAAAQLRRQQLQGRRRQAAAATTAHVPSKLAVACCLPIVTHRLPKPCGNSPLVFVIAAAADAALVVMTNTKGLLPHG